MFDSLKKKAKSYMADKFVNGYTNKDKVLITGAVVAGATAVTMLPIFPLIAGGVAYAIIKDKK